MKRVRLTWSMAVASLILIGLPLQGCNYDFTPLDPDGGSNPDASGPDSTVDAEPDAAPPCGDGIIEAAEQCDGTNLDGQSCVSQGWVAGTLVCQDCAFDESDCQNDCGANSVPCPASSISDDFEDGIMGAIWASYAEGGATAQEIGGELVLTLFPGGLSAAGYETSDVYDLLTYSVTVELVSGTNPVPSAACYLTVTNPSTYDIAGIILNEGYISMFYYLDQVSYDDESVPHDPQSHRYWRLRALGGYFFADTSPDGVVWTNLGGGGAPFPMNAVLLAIETETWAAEASPGEAHFDNFNILP